MGRQSMRRSTRRSTGPSVSRYNQKTLRRDREYGFYWYSWLWKIFRPAMVLLCSVVIVLGIVATGWKAVNDNFFLATAPGDQTSVDFVVNRGDSVSTIGKNLEQENLLRNPGIFRYIVQFQGVTNKFQYGNYPLTRDMDVFQIIDKLTEGSATNERSITIIPGWTMKDIAADLVKKGALKDTDEFLVLANSLETFQAQSYVLQDAMSMGAINGRLYQLEGYLAPDTYRVYTNATAQDIILTILRQSDKVRDGVFFAEIEPVTITDEFGNPVEEEEDLDEFGNPIEQFKFETSLNRDQTMILASIIEKEAGLRADYAKVSAVFHNRLEKGMRLESDATTAYPLGINRIVLTASELETINGYNTYTLSGLPIGPICNPSKAAIEAALYPDTDYIYDDYLYFCAGDPEKNETVFARTKEEHQANVSQYRPLWVAQDQRQQRNAEQ